MKKKISKTLIFSLSAAALLLALAFHYFMPKSYEIGMSTPQNVYIENVTHPDVSSFFNDKIIPNEAFVRFKSSILKPDVNDEKLNEALQMTPAIRGKWRIISSKYFAFAPELDWVPNTEYKVAIPKSIVLDNINLKDKNFVIKSPLFAGNIQSSSLYENPKDIKQKHAMASFSFSYPLATKDLEKRIKVYDTDGKKHNFTYNLTDKNRVLHIMSNPLQIKKNAYFINVELDGIVNDYNGEKMSEKLKTVITVPSISQFFKVNSINSQIIRNEQKNNQPEQILTINLSTAVSSQNMKDNLSLYQTNEWCSKAEEDFAYIINSKQQIPSNFKKLPLTAVSVDKEYSNTHSFRYDFIGGKNCLLVSIGNGLTSQELYRLPDGYASFISASEYPLETSIAFEGSIIPLKGDKNLALISRGVDRIETKVARINTKDLNHLITQTSGKFSTPYFNNYNFNEDNIAEVFEKTLAINSAHPAEENYSSINLADYFENKKGIFLVNVNGYKNYNPTAKDTRLIVITDLGIIVKENADYTQSVFVSSIENEAPVNNALIEVLGKNGLPVLSTRTNADGFAKLANLSSFENDKTPVVYKVSYENDISYLPVNRYDRKLDLSRFDVGGVYESEYAPKNIVSAYGFSDRGIYRPNEDAYFALIVRQKNLQVPQKLPMKLDILNPNGDKIAEKKVWPDEFGMIDYKQHIPANAALGYYNLNLRQIVDNDEYYHIASVSFNVQEFAPDTMRLKLSLENAPAKGWYIGKQVTALVDLQNLYGNPAAGHTVRGSYTLNPTSFYFKDYADYNFRDPLRLDAANVQHYNEQLPIVKTNQNGKAEFEIKLSDFEKGTYNLALNVDGMEANSGRGVSSAISMLVSPNKHLVGYKIDGSLDYIYKDTERSVSFVAIDNELKQIELKNLSIAVYKRDYISSLIEMPDRTYRYQMMPKESVVSKGEFAVSAVETKYVLNTEEPGEYFILLEDKDGKILSKISYSVVGSQNTTYSLDKDASLDIVLNKSEFNDGEAVQMQIKAPYSGYGLITIEQNKVYAYKWFRAETSSSMQEIVIPQGVEGNAYVNVSWVRSLDSKEIFVSPLSYGVVPFSINKASRRLDIHLDVPEVVKPGEEMLLSYTSSQPAEIVVFGANNGILQLARYKTPNPLGYFMQKKALRVVTMQILDLILPDIKIVRYLKSVGGDMQMEEEMLSKLNPFARKQDKPVAFWSGLVKAENQKKTYKYLVPENFNGEIKIMAVGVSNQQMGQVEKRVLVRGDFAIVPSGPFNVSPNDEFVVAASVANMIEGVVGETPVEVTLLAGQGVEIIGESAKILNLSYRQEGQAEFKLKALDKLGSIPLVFKVTSLKNAKNSSRISYEIGVRPSNPYITDLQMGYTPSKLKLKNFVEPMFEEYRNQEIVVSNSPLVLTQGLLGFLDKFPHSCTEQSVSKAFPAMEIFFNKPELVEGMDVYATYDDVLAKLIQRQNLDGSFKSWPSSPLTAKQFDSLYTLQFLTQAQKHNLDVPQGLLKKSLGYAASVASKNASDYTNSNPAYAAYLLTLNGEMTSNYLIKIEEELNLAKSKDARNSLSAAYLAASYKLLQNEDKARKLLGNYKFGKNSIDDARYAYLMATHFPEDFVGLQQKTIEALLKPLKNGNFTTISSATSLLALNAIGQSQDDENVAFNGKKYEGKGFASLPLDASVGELVVSSEKPFYYVINQQGFMKQGVTKPTSKGMEIYKEYLDKDGKPVENLKIGDEVTVKIKVIYLNGDYLNDVAIIDMIPGCFDIVKNSITGEIDNSEVREDRALIYMPISSQTKEVSYRAKVVASGTFAKPAVFAEALYDPSVRANSKADTINVSK